MQDHQETIPSRQEITDGTRAAVEQTERFLARHKSAELNKPAEPDDSVEAKLYSAYDAVEAALGWLSDARDELGDPGYPVEQEHTDDCGGTAEQMGKDIYELCDSVEALMSAYGLIDPDGPHGEETPEDEEARTLRRAHEAAEAGMGRLEDARDLMLGRTSPKDNPAPYEDGNGDVEE